MHMTISFAIMLVTVSNVAIYVTVSSSNCIFLSLTDIHFLQNWPENIRRQKAYIKFAFQHFSKYSSKFTWKLAKRFIQYFCFPDRPKKDGDILHFSKGGNLRILGGGGGGGLGEKVGLTEKRGV